MEQVLPWAELVERITPYYPVAMPDGRYFSLKIIRYSHFKQQLLTLTGLGMEEAFFNTPRYREFTQLEEFVRFPD